MSSTNKPFFSIILPTYNVEKYIERCIKSCINQSYKNFELIFVDDCGNDNSINIVKKWKNINNRILIVHNSINLGTFHARKKGVESAQGNYILFLDPDDTIPSDTLEKLKIKIDASKADLIIYSLEIINDTISKKLIPKNHQKKSKKNVLSILFNDIKNIHYGTPGKLYSNSLLKKAYKKLSYIKNRLVYAEDILLLYTAAGLSKEILIVKDAFYIYYQNMESITTQIDKNAQIRHITQLNEIINHIKKIAIDKEISHINSYYIDQATKKIVNQLIYDKEMKNRFLHDPQNDKPMYLKSILLTIRSKPRFKNVLRLIIYIASFKKIKL